MYDWLVALGYVGAFLAPLIGVFTYYLVPWPLVIFALGAFINPLIVAALGATGSTLGTFLYYFVGEGVYRILPERIKVYMDRGEKYLDVYGALAIFVFALLPLPDEVVWIPIGIVKYDKRKALTSCWLGKFLLIAAIAFAGFYGLDFLIDIFR